MHRALGAPDRQTLSGRDGRRCARRTWRDAAAWLPARPVHSSQERPRHRSPRQSPPQAGPTRCKTRLETRSWLSSKVTGTGTFWDRQQAPNVVLAHYADLQANLEGEMRRLAGLLGIVIGEDVWPGLVAEAGFDRMRDRANEVAPQATMDGLWHDTSRFFHRGTSGQWRTFLSSEDLDRYEARVRQLAAPDLATWAHDGWRDYRRLKRAGFPTPS